MAGEARVGFNGPEHSPGINVSSVMQYAREGWCFLNWHETKQAVSDWAQIRDLKWPLGGGGKCDGESYGEGFSMISASK